jgi:putative hemolysin
MLTILFIILLLALSASFSGSETSLFSLSRSEVAKFRAMNNVFARNVTQVLSHPRKLLVSILLGNELVNVAIAILVAGLVYDAFFYISWQVKLLLSVAVSTPLIVIIGEVIPKNIGIRYASFLAQPCAFYIKWFSWVLAPLRWLLLKMADGVIKLAGGSPKNVRSMIMEEEFRQLVELGCSEGSIGEAEGELIHSLLDMADKKAEDVMTPREAIFAVSLNEELDTAMAGIRTSHFARIPVYDTDPDDIVGILHVRDMFAILRRRKIKRIRDIEQIIRPAYFMQGRSTLEQVLRDFQRLKVHMGIVIDDSRRPVGIITMEDMFSALFEG